MRQVLSIVTLTLSLAFLSVYTVAHAKNGRSPAVESKEVKEVPSVKNNIASALVAAYK